MKYRRFSLASSFFLGMILLLSCESEYTKTVNREADRGIRKDSLVLGMSFGYTKQNFFDHCWKLNKKGLVTQGPNNRSVQYLLSSNEKDENLTAILMLFYGNFNENNIMTGMDMEFSYKAWAPWNKNMYSDKLVPVLMDTLLDWFPGNKFMNIRSDKLDTETYVKVDGNRQIMVYPKGNKNVVVKIEDLKYKYPEKFKLSK